MKTITFDSRLYMVAADFVGYTIADAFLGNETEDAFVRAFCTHGTPSDGVIKDFSDRVVDLFNDGYLWLSEEEADAAIALRREEGEHVTGEVTGFTLRGILHEIIRKGETIIEQEANQ